MTDKMLYKTFSEPEKRLWKIERKISEARNARELICSTFVFFFLLLASYIFINQYLANHRAIDLQGSILS